MRPETLEVLRLDYEKTQNPIVAWFAYSMCRIERVEIPEWIGLYLDRAADEVLGHDDPDHPGNETFPPPRFRLELRGPPGRGTAKSSLDIEIRNRLINRDVETRINGGQKPGKAVAGVADRYSLSVDAV
jgi:hypothetical protein